MPDPTLISPSTHADQDDQPRLISDSDQRDLTLNEYAALTGQSPHTVRTKIRKGEIAARLVKGQRGLEYRIPSSVSVTVISDSTQPDQDDHPSLRSASSHADHTLIDLVDRLSQENTRLQDERAELYGRLGFYQSEIQHLQAQLGAAHERIALLEAPKNSASGETTNHPTPRHNGPDSASQQAQRRPWWAFWRWGAATPA